MPRIKKPNAALQQVELGSFGYITSIVTMWVIITEATSTGFNIVGVIKAFPDRCIFSYWLVDLILEEDTSSRVRLIAERDKKFYYKLLLKIILHFNIFY